MTQLSEQDLPPDWSKVPLGDLAQVKYGKAIPKDEGPFPAIGSGGEYARVNQALIEYPTIVVGRKGTAGRVWLSLEPSWPSDTTFYLDWTSEVDVEFIYSALVANPIRGVQGDVLPSLKRPDLQEVHIAVPPLPEQRAIADVLRTVQRTKEATEQVIAAVRDLKKSLMRHLFIHGPVGVAEVSDAPAWDRKPLSQIVDPARPVRRGIDQPGPNVPDGVPFVNLGDIAEGRIMTAELKRTSREIAEKNKRSQLRSGDVLISIRATAGRVAVVPEELDGIHTARGMARISPADWIDSDFVAYFMQSEEAQTFLESSMRGVALRQVNLQDLRTMSVPVPPRQVQEQIASSLKAVDKKLVAEEARRDALATLFDSLLRDLMTARLRVGDFEFSA